MHKKKLVKQMPPDMMHIVLANMSVKLLNAYVSQGSGATYLRGSVSFNSSFLHRSSF